MMCAMDTLTPPPSSPYPTTKSPVEPSVSPVQSERAKHLLVWIVLACVFLTIVILMFLAFSIQKIRPEPIENVAQQFLVPLPSASPTPEAVSLGAEIYEKSSNPAQTAVPESNPFKNPQTNPFNAGYKNPFAE